MMAPFVYEKARANAALHVQIRRSGPQMQPSHSDSVLMTGRVMRIFRNKGNALLWGQKIRFAVPVINPARSSEHMLGGTIYHALDRIGPARYLEAFLECWKGEVYLVHSQIVVIRHPTLRPVCGADAKGFLCAGNA